MDDDDIKRDREAIAAATPGPWRFGAADAVRLVEDGNGYRFAQVDDDGNGAFIAAARTRWPVALDALEAARRELAEARQNGRRSYLDDTGIALDKAMRDLAAERATHATAESARRALECELGAAEDTIEKLSAELDTERGAFASTEEARIAAMEDVDRWKARAEALARFARHADDCAVESHPLYDGPCTCGLDAARKDAGL